MGYTNEEKEIINYFQNTNLEKAPSEEVLPYLLRLSELKLESRTQIIQMIPELANLINNSLDSYCQLANRTFDSNDKSMDNVYQIFNKLLDNSQSRSVDDADLIKSVQTDLSKCLDKENISEETIKEILEKDIELVRLKNQENANNREYDLEVGKMAEKKDSENKDFGKSILKFGLYGFAFVGAIGLGYLTGKNDIDIFKKS